MDERMCRGCGAAEEDGANFCSHCGIPAGAKYIDLAESDQPEAQSAAKPRLSTVLVPLGVAGLIGLLTVALLSAGGDNEGEQARGAAIDDRDIADSTPTAALTATPRATPTSAPAAVRTPVDPSDLPSMQATHLAVGYRSTVYFLDLRTGAWSETEVGRRLAAGGGQPFDSGGTYPFGDGVLVETETGGAVSVPLSGEPLVLASGGGTTHLRSVRNGLAFIEDFGAPDRDRHLRVSAPTGETVYEIPLGSRMWAAGVTADGLVVVQAGAGVFLVGVNTSTRLSDGLVSGVIDNKVIVQDCASLTACSSELVDAATGERTPIVVDANFFDQGNNGEVVGYGSDGLPRRYRLVDNELVQVAFALDSEQGLAFTTDTSGVSARVIPQHIEFVDEAGELLVSIPFAVENCCSGQFGVTFINTDT